MLQAKLNSLRLGLRRRRGAHQEDRADDRPAVAQSLFATPRMMSMALPQARGSVFGVEQSSSKACRPAWMDGTEVPHRWVVRLPGLLLGKPVDDADERSVFCVVRLPDL